jgi:hypothetical protein
MRAAGWWVVDSMGSVEGSRCVGGGAEVLGFLFCRLSVVREIVVGAGVIVGGLICRLIASSFS